MFLVLLLNTFTGRNRLNRGKWGIRAIYIGIEIWKEKKSQVFKANIISFGGFLIKEGKPLNPMELFP